MSDSDDDSLLSDFKVEVEFSCVHLFWEGLDSRLEREVHVFH